MDTIRVHRVLFLVVSIVLSACAGQTAVPSPTPTPAPSATVAAIATATPAASPIVTSRVVKPFVRVVRLSLSPEVSAAIDRDRVVLKDASGLHVLDVATGQRRTVYAATRDWSIDLSPRGLRGDILVFAEHRVFEGADYDVRVIRVDLRTGIATTIDEWPGPFLGGGDTWRPRAPVTNGKDILWIRVTLDAKPYSAEVMLAPAAGLPRTIWTARSSVWADLDESGRVAVSTLITERDRAELVYWSAGLLTSAGDRPSPEGGPVLFIGRSGDVFWAEGPGIARSVTRGELLGPTGVRRPIDLGPGCNWLSATADHLHLACGGGQSDTMVLFDPASGARESIATARLIAGHGAALWRDGTQWWLGILGP